MIQLYQEIIFHKLGLGMESIFLAISDGMGSGANARRNSKIAISMLERLFKYRF